MKLMTVATLAVGLAVAGAAGAASASTAVVISWAVIMGCGSLGMAMCVQRRQPVAVVVRSL